MVELEQIETFRLVAADFATKGADVAKTYFGSVSVDQKHDRTPVTEADHAAQAAILEAIGSQFPGHSVICEETVQLPQQHADVGEARFCWVIDPIDGTRNFAAGIPVYGCSVGLLHDGVPLAGAIYDAATSRVYSAGKRAGAFCDDVRIESGRLVRESELLILISSFRKKPMPEPVRDWTYKYNYRNQGSLSLHLAWVAAGLADVAYAAECKLWDIAAGVLIVEEAGRKVSRADGAPLWPLNPETYRGDDLDMLAAARPIHERLLKTLFDHQ